MTDTATRPELPAPTAPPSSPRPPRGGRGRSRGLAVAAVVLVAVVLSFAFGHDSSSSGRPDGAARTAPAHGSAVTTVPSGASIGVAQDEAATSSASGSGGQGDVAQKEAAPGAAAGTPPALSAAKIVKSASLELQVRKGAVSAAFDRLTTLAAGAGGIVSQQQTTESGGSPSGTVTIRVPSAAFEGVLAEARKIGTVTSSTTGGQDVTAEYTDTAGRLKSLNDERDQLSLVLGTAGNVTDILSVRDRMTSVQTEIEQLQGRINVLDDQVSLATLTVSVREKGDVATVVPSTEKTGFSKAWADAVHGFNSSLQSILAGSGRTLVVLLGGLVLLLVGRIALKAGRRRWPAEGTPTPTTA